MTNELDDLIKSLQEQKRPVVKRRKAVVEPGKRVGGRHAALYREEVDQILTDHRPMKQIAHSWGVSEVTIKRVKRRGRFANIPYIPRDEEDRENGNMMANYSVTLGGKRGRPFATGRVPPSIEEQALMAIDWRPTREIAAEHDVTPAYVSKMRKEINVGRLRRGLAGLEDLRRIKRDTRHTSVIALEFDMPEIIVEFIRHAKIKGRI